MTIGNFLLKNINWNSTKFAVCKMSFLNKISLIFILFCLNTSSLSSQVDTTTNLTLLSTFSIKNTFFTTDKLLNTYIITDEDEIIKLNSEAKETYRYSNTSLGQATYIDTTDPFNLLVYYKDYQTVVVLDRTMTETAILNLVKFDLFDVNAVGLSSNNNIWVFDELNFRLKKMDRNGNTIHESDDLSLLLDTNFSPNFLIEREQMVFVNDPNVGVLVFDFFGQFIKTLNFKDLENFQIIENRIIFQEENSLQSFNLKSLLQQPLNLPFLINEKETIRIEKGRFFVKNGEGIKIYSL